MMLTPLILSLSLAGQYRACTTATTYGHSHVGAAYASTGYAAAAYAQPYVEKEIFVAVQSDPYYSALVGDQVRAEIAKEKAETDKARAEAALQARIGSLNETVSRLEARLGVAAAAGAGPAPSSGTSPTPVPAPPPATTVPAPAPASPVATPSVPASGLSEAAVAASALLKTNCAKCHSGKAGGGGGFTIFADDKSTLANLHPLDLLRIDQAVYSGQMPPDKPPLGAEDYSALRAWIDESRDEINLALKHCKAAGAVASAVRK